MDEGELRTTLAYLLDQKTRADDQGKHHAATHVAVRRARVRAARTPTLLMNAWLWPQGKLRALKPLLEQRGIAVDVPTMMEPNMSSGLNLDTSDDDSMTLWSLGSFMSTPERTTASPRAYSCPQKHVPLLLQSVSGNSMSSVGGMSSDADSVGVSDTHPDDMMVEPSVSSISGLTCSLDASDDVSAWSPRPTMGTASPSLCYPDTWPDFDIFSLVFEADTCASRIKIAEEQLKAQMEDKIATLRAALEQHVQDEMANLKRELRRELRQFAANAAAASNKRPRSPPAAANDDERSPARARSNAPPMSPRSSAISKALGWFGPIRRG